MTTKEILARRSEVELEWSEPLPGYAKDGERVVVDVSLRAKVEDCLRIARTWLVAKNPHASLSEIEDERLLDDFQATHWSVVAHVFEMLDASKDEDFVVLGLFSSLQGAMQALDRCGGPDSLPGEREDDDSCRVEVRARKFGMWDDLGRLVHSREWRRGPDGKWQVFVAEKKENADEKA